MFCTHEYNHLYPPLFLYKAVKLIKSLTSRDQKTAKYLQKTDDGHVIETGYYNLDECIICISTQVGCKIGCIFLPQGN